MRAAAVSRVLVISHTLFSGLSRAAELSAAPSGAVLNATLGDIDLVDTFINRALLYNAYCVQYRYDAPETPGRPYLCPGA